MSRSALRYGLRYHPLLVVLAASLAQLFVSINSFAQQNSALVTESAQLIVDAKQIGRIKFPAAPISLELLEINRAAENWIGASFTARLFVALKDGGVAYFVRQEARGTVAFAAIDSSKISAASGVVLPVYVDARAGFVAPATVNLHASNKPDRLGDLAITVRRTDRGPELAAALRVLEGQPVILVCAAPSCDSEFIQKVGSSLANAVRQAQAPTSGGAISANGGVPKKQILLYSFDPQTGRLNGDYSAAISAVCDLTVQMPMKQIMTGGTSFDLPAAEGDLPYCIQIADKYSLTKFRCYRLPQLLALPAIAIPLNGDLLRTYESCPEPSYYLEVLEERAGQLSDKTQQLRSLVSVRGTKVDAQGKIRVPAALTPGDVHIESEDYRIVPNGIRTTDHGVLITVERVTIETDTIRFRLVDDLGRPEKYCVPELVIPTEAILPRSLAGHSEEYRLKLVFDGQKDRLYYKVQQPSNTQRAKLLIPNLEKPSARIELKKDVCILGGRSRLELNVSELRSGDVTKVVYQAKPFLSLVMIPDTRLSKTATDAERSRLWSMILNAFDRAVFQSTEIASAWDTVQISVAAGDGKFIESAIRSPEDPPFSSEAFSNLNSALVSRSTAGERQVQVPINESLFRAIASQAGVTTRPRQVMILVGGVVDNSGICGDLTRGETSKYGFMTEGQFSDLIVIDFRPNDPTPGGPVVPLDSHTGEVLTCNTAGTKPAGREDIADRIGYLAIDVRRVLQSSFIQRDVEQRLADEIKKRLLNLHEARR